MATESHRASCCFNRLGKTSDMNPCRLLPQSSAIRFLTSVRFCSSHCNSHVCTETQRTFFVSVIPSFAPSVVSLPYPRCPQVARGHFISCINNSPEDTRPVYSGCLKQAAALIWLCRQRFDEGDLSPADTPLQPWWLQQEQFTTGIVLQKNKFCIDGFFVHNKNRTTDLCVSGFFIIKVKCVSCKRRKTEKVKERKETFPWNSQGSEV